MSRTCDICTAILPDDRGACPRCGMEPDEEYRESSQQESAGPWAVVRIVSTVIEAELMAGRLRNEGIPAIVLSQVDSTRNLTVGGLAIAKVYVRGVDFGEADRILSVDADSEFGHENPESGEE